MRVKIPESPDPLLELAKKIGDKHAADGDDSPLKGLDMTAFSAKAKKADENNELFKKLSREAEKASQDRDIALGKSRNDPGTLMAYVCAVRDTLLGKFRGSEKTLGEWGFIVDDTARAKKTTTATTTTPPPAP